MGAWRSDSLTHVATMTSGDFRSNEQSVTTQSASTVRIEHVATDGTVTPLKTGLSLQAGEVIDSSVMEKQALLTFLSNEIADAKDKGILFFATHESHHDEGLRPHHFGHAVETYFKSLFEMHGQTLQDLGVDVRNGFGDLESKLPNLPADLQDSIRTEISRIL